MKHLLFTFLFLGCGVSANDFEMIEESVEGGVSDGHEHDDHNSSGVDAGINHIVHTDAAVDLVGAAEGEIRAVVSEDIGIDGSPDITIDTDSETAFEIEEDAGSDGSSVSDSGSADSGSTDLDCHDGGVEINSLADMQSIAEHECITGTLEIYETDIAELDLPNLVLVGGMVVYANHQLTDLTGLDSLESAQFVGIVGNDNLVDLSALKLITELPEYLAIRNNDSLPAIRGFEDLTVVGDLYIRNNKNLVESFSFNSISAMGVIYVEDNINLPNCYVCDLLDAIPWTESHILGNKSGDCSDADGRMWCQ